MTVRLPDQNAVGGFSLIEALVTMAILSLGLLGVAGLIAASLKLNQGAALRAQASWAAADMVERMRANRSRAAAGDYALASCANPPVSGGVASADLAAWCASLAVNLPGADATVALLSNKVRVAVQWDDARVATGLAGDTASQSFTVETRL